MSAGAGPSAARRTVIIALAANASIAVAKLAAGVASGSSAMLAEAAEARERQLAGRNGSRH